VIPIDKIKVLVNLIGGKLTKHRGFSFERQKSAVNLFGSTQNKARGQTRKLLGAFIRNFLVFSAATLLF